MNKQILEKVADYLSVPVDEIVEIETMFYVVNIKFKSGKSRFMSKKLIKHFSSDV